MSEEEIDMDKKVKIYTTPSCHYCHQAMEFLESKGISFETYDVSKDGEALQQMKRISGGARSVPVIAFCDEVMVGFDQSKLEKALSCIE